MLLLAVAVGITLLVVGGGIAVKASVDRRRRHRRRARARHYWQGYQSAWDKVFRRPRARRLTYQPVEPRDEDVVDR